MLKYLLATAAAIAMIASASAQTMDGTKDAPTTYEKKYAFECTITKVAPPDHDKNPAYKVNIWTNDKYIVRIAHTLTSGDVVYRGSQYSDTGSSPMNGEDADFSNSALMWWGKSKQHPELTMLGWIGTLKGKLVYKEEVFKGKASPVLGDTKAKPVLTIDSTCHEVEV